MSKVYLPPHGITVLMDAAKVKNRDYSKEDHPVQINREGHNDGHFGGNFGRERQDAAARSGSREMVRQQKEEKNDVRREGKLTPGSEKWFE